MILIVIILILELLVEIQAGCPVRCNCTKNSVTCISKNLEYVPYFESLSNSPLIIDLSGNSISIIDIDDFSFDKSDQVKEIYLNNSELTTIEEKSFEELENLQELYLSHNFLNSLPEDFILKNENMILLDISSNYFADMPKIKSNSLEVLAIASSGVSKVAVDALSGLPNLRVLLLQQNNLKNVDPVIFDQMSNLFFVKMVYNPWQCNCKTVKLFQYLADKRFVDITEPIQCQTEDNFFIDIYTDKGIANSFKGQCTNFSDDSEPITEKNELLRNINTSKKVQDTDASIISKNNGNKMEINYLNSTDLYYLVILWAAIVMSLITGTIFGSCITFKFMRKTIRQSESWKQLLPKSNENFA